MTPRSKFAALSMAVLISASAALFVSPSHADEAEAKRELIVGTKEAPPFSFKDEKGDWTDISIDLWRRIATILAWLIQRGGARSIELADLTFGPQDYVIAIRNGSELRKRIDVALLQTVQSDWWKENLARYIGSNADNCQMVQC